MKKSLLILVSAFVALAVNAEDPYIESLGTSGISTGYRMKGGISRVEVDYQLTQVFKSRTIFGDYAKENAFQTFYYTTGDTTPGFKFGIRPKPTGTTSDYVKLLADTDRHVAIIDLYNKKHISRTAGTNDFSNSFTADYSGLVAAMPLTLFGNYGDTNATSFASQSLARIYGVKIYESDLLVHDFVPCKKDGKTPCFKDLVGGGFIIGEDIAAFRASDNVPTYQDDGYISTVSETAGEYFYADTGYLVKNTTRVELDCALASNMVSKAFWCLFDAYSSARFRMAYNPYLLQWVGTASGGTALQIDNFPQPTHGKDVRRTFVLDIPGASASVITSGFTNHTVAVSDIATYASSGSTLKLACTYGDTWAIASSGLAPLKIYRCKIYESGTLVHDFVPYVKNGFSGLRNETTGAFIQGKVKTSGAAGTVTNLPYGGRIKGEQDAYIESNGTTGMNTGYKMKGAISRVEMDFCLTTTNDVASKYVYGDNAIETSKLQTFLYFTATRGFKFCNRPYTNNGDDNAYSVYADLERHTVVQDLSNKKTKILTGTATSQMSFPYDFARVEAEYPLPIFARYYTSTSTYQSMVKARIYSVRFYENYVEGGNNVPVCELVPYSRGGVVGFYDTVTGEIVKNDSAAAGAFTFGGVGTDHGELNCYIKPGYATKVTYGGTAATLTAYAPGATSYRWLMDGEPVAGGTDGVLSVNWSKGSTRTSEGHLHTYQAVAVFNLYGVERESEPTAEASITSIYTGTMIVVR